MKKSVAKFLLLIACVMSLLSADKLHSTNVGMLIVATGKYIQFVPPLIESARKHFCKNHRVTYFVFTDQPLTTSEDVVRIQQERLGWPYDTMNRYHIYYKNRELFSNQDYLFAIDADMLFVDEVGDEILGELVATQHPGFIGRRGTYETNPQSLAYVAAHEGSYYFAGGFYGGTKEQLLKLFETNIQDIDSDLRQGVIAIWHDESHWNRYCIDHPPTVILNPSYCSPQSWSTPFPKKLIALDKNHSEFQIPK
jgi:histo-blood group ABO system transferase